MTNPDPIGTVPESLATLLHQQFQLENGKRPVMVFPIEEYGNIRERLPLPKGMDYFICSYGIFHFNPNWINPETIIEALKMDTIGQWLLLGPYSKADIQAMIDDGEQECAIVERTPMEVEVRAAWSCERVAGKVFSYFFETRDPGNAITIETCENVLHWRRTHP